MLPRSRILARLTRQARNAVLLAEGLRERCDIGLVEHAGLVFCAHRRADRLVAIIERLALARGIRVVCGTSFGFNDTRITLVPGEEGRLRFACGMEQEPAMNAILELVQQAVAAVEHAEVRQQCVHLSRFFPDYPQRTTASSEEQVALEQHLRAFERTVMNAIDGRSS